MSSASAIKTNKNTAGIEATSANAASIDDLSVEELGLGTLIHSDTSTLVPITGINAAIKRLEDFVLGSIALLILFPLMALISIAIKLDSTGPALFCQARSGRNREIIKVYKFRRSSSRLRKMIHASRVSVRSCERPASTNCHSCSM